MKAPTASKKKVCPQGHVFMKSSDCPVCPVCAARNKPDDGFLSLLAAPARRALQNAGIHSVAALANLTETEVLALHGMGPSSLPRLKQALARAGLSFKDPA